MEKRRFIPAVILLILCLSLVFAAGCGNKDDRTENTDITKNKDETLSPSVTDTAQTTAPLSLNLVENGKSDYTVVIPESKSNAVFRSAASDLVTAVKDATGIYIRITTDFEKYKVSDNEICLGSVNRNGKYYDIDTSAMKDNEFIVKVCGTRLVFTGKNDYASKAAADWFISEYLAGGKGSMQNLSLPSDFSYTGTFELSSSIRIMTQNLLATDEEYENLSKDPKWGPRLTADLSKHTLDQRHPRFISLIDKYKPDSIGVQECSNSWRQYLDKNLKAIGYKRIGASRNGKIGIIYNEKTLKPISNNSIWLTEQPTKIKISKEWGSPSDGLSERLAMYVVFESVHTGRRFIHINTHLDTAKNSIIQTKQVQVILNYIDELKEKFGNIPVVITGDLNFNSSSSAYKAALSTVLCDTKKACTDSQGDGSFNKFIGKEYSSLPIDHIFASKKEFIFSKYRVIYDKSNDCFVSDHYAIITDLIISESN